MAIAVGERAAPVSGATKEGPHALLFYKVTCPTCQIAAPVLDGFERAYPGRVTGVGQDPPEKLREFSSTYSMSFQSIPDLPPYEASNGYGIEHVPTMVVIDGQGRVADVVESWDRSGYNRLSATLAALLEVDPVPISDSMDGLPEFRPG